VFSRTKAEQRIRRLLAACGHPGLRHAASHLGIRPFILARQIRDLEAETGTALLHTGQDGRLTLTAHGEQFARDVMPALEALDRSSKNKSADTQRNPDSPSE